MLLASHPDPSTGPAYLHSMLLEVWAADHSQHPTSSRELPSSDESPFPGKLEPPILSPGSSQLTTDCYRSTKGHTSCPKWSNTEQPRLCSKAPYPSHGSDYSWEHILGGLLPLPYPAWPPPLLRTLSQQFTCTIPASGSASSGPKPKESFNSWTINFTWLPLSETNFQDQLNWFLWEMETYEGYKVQGTRLGWASQGIKRAVESNIIAGVEWGCC